SLCSMMARLLALEEKTERRERTNLKELEVEETARSERHLVHSRLGLSPRPDVHQEDHARLVYHEEKLFDPAVEVKLERVRNFLRHDLLFDFIRDGLHALANSQNFHE